MRVSHNTGFADVLNEAQRSGPAALSNGELLQFCRTAYGYFETHFLIKARPFFIELWRRIEAHQIKGVRTKTEACRQIGCSLRWAEMIIAGTAKESNKHKVKNKRSVCEVSSHSHAMSDHDYVDVVARYADSKLEAVKSQNWGRFQEICRLLAESFQQAAKGLSS